MKKKEFKIAKIIDTTTVVITGGTNQGVDIDDEFDIVGNGKSSIVKDPDTGETIGYLSSPKGRIAVTQVFKDMSIAKTPHERYKSDLDKITKDSTRRMMVNGSISPFLFGALPRKRLNVDENEITGMPDKDNSPVKIGDLVIEA